MSPLKWNHRKVQSLTPWELWMYILARGFMGFGVGVMAMQYYPRLFACSGLFMFVIGLILFSLAVIGLKRKSPPAN